MNTDDAYGRRLAGMAGIPVITLSAEGDPAADWRAVDVRTGADGSTFRIVGPGGVEADASVALPGLISATMTAVWGTAWAGAAIPTSDAAMTAIMTPTARHLRLAPHLPTGLNERRNIRVRRT